MAHDEHRIKFRSGDLVMLSARLIPRNEEDIFRVVDALSKKGVEILHRANAPIHASGYAPSIELAHVLGVIRPKRLLLIHGEWRHLRAYARIAYDMGMSDGRVLFLGNGDVLDLVADHTFVVEKYAYNNTYVDSGTVGLVAESTLKERRRLGQSGVVNVALVVDAFSDQLIVRPAVTIRGVPVDLFDSVETSRVARTAMKQWTKSGSRDTSTLECIVRRALERWIYEVYSIRPCCPSFAGKVPRVT